MDSLRSSSNDDTIPESFRLTKDQKNLWDLFRHDTTWQIWLKNNNERYNNREGFRHWCSSAYKKPVVYADERKAAQKEWNKSATQKSFMDTGWAAANSWFFCVDSFTAWLRQRGKFCGSEELLDNKKKWEADPDRDKSEPEIKSFNTWMRKKGLENPDRQESTANEVRKRFEAWRTDWLSSHPEATPHDPHEEEKRQWNKIEEALKHEIKQADEKRERSKKNAQKRDKEPFLERWRKGWNPEMVNWKEFEVMLDYGRHWVKLMRRGKKEYGEFWLNPLAITGRQSLRAGSLDKRKKGVVVSYAEWKTPNRKESNQASEVSNPEHDFVLHHLLLRPNSENTAAKHEEHEREASLDEYTTPNKSPPDPSRPDATADELALAQIEELDAAIDNGKLGELNQALYAVRKTGFKSKEDLDFWVKWKNSCLNRHLKATHYRIAEDVDLWLQDAPRFLGKDGKFHLNYSRQSYAVKELEKKQRNKHWQEELKNQKQKQPADQKGREDAASADSGASEGHAEGVNGTTEAVNGNGHGNENGSENGNRNGNGSGNESGHDRMTDQNSGESTGNDTATAIPGVHQNEPPASKIPMKIYRQTLRLSDKQKKKYNQNIETRFATEMGDDWRSYYEMMGECYVYGMMDGEAMAHQNDAGKKTTVFEIR